MMHDHKPPRQPLFWAALAFSTGLWIGVRAWRPPSWWVMAVLVFVLAAWWFVPRRAWMAKSLSLGTWILLGAFLIQVRAGQAGNPQMSVLADGREVTLTAHVIREGYARAAGPRSMRESIDVETEGFESEGESRPVRAGIRLAVMEKVERRASSPSDAAGVAKWTGEAPVSPITYGTRLRIRAKLHPARNFRNPGAFDYEGYLQDNGISVLGSAQAGQIEPLEGFSTQPARNSSARAPIMCWSFPG
jgi:hypothetical protein